MIAQNQFTIENNAENAAVFDTDNPNSFMSLLKFNSWYLRGHDTQGIKSVTYHSLSAQDKESIFTVIGNEGTVPLIDKDPSSPYFGENIIVIDENGFEAYAYERPDTLRTDFERVSQITFDYADGDGPIWDRIGRVKLWKEYDEKLHQVLSLTGQGFLSFDCFSLLNPLDLELTKKLTDTSDPKSLLNVMRDEAMVKFDLISEGEEVYNIKDLTTHVFPSNEIRQGHFISTGGARFVKENRYMKGYPFFYNEEFIESLRPFSIDFGTKVLANIGTNKEDNSMFDMVYVNVVTSTIHLVEEDPNSPNFGEYLITVNAEGQESYVFPEPMPIYYWVDYSGAKIFASQTFYNNEEGGVAQPLLEDLFFTKEIAGKDEVIFHIQYSEAMKDHFESFKAPELENFEWHQIFTAASKDIESHSISIH